MAKYFPRFLNRFVPLTQIDSNPKLLKDEEKTQIPIYLHHEQCDQIWLNFATLVKFQKYFLGEISIWLNFNLFWQIFVVANGQYVANIEQILNLANAAPPHLIDPLCRVHTDPFYAVSCCSLCK